MCADNGVVCENVTQTGMEITALVTENFTKNKTSASVMANSLNIDVFPVDIGVYRDLENVIKKEEEIVPRKIIDRKIEAEEIDGERIRVKVNFVVEQNIAKEST